jgi:hypothetical protein
MRQRLAKKLQSLADEVGKSPPTQPWRYDGMVDPQICRLLLIDVGLSEALQTNISGESSSELEKSTREWKNI